jgi:hypothetical protein
LSLPKMPFGANAFEISNIQEAETEGPLTRRSGCNKVARSFCVPTAPASPPGQMSAGLFSVFSRTSVQFKSEINATPEAALRVFYCLLRDQEVGGSNPLAPTTLSHKRLTPHENPKSASLETMRSFFKAARRERFFILWVHYFEIALFRSRHWPGGLSPDDGQDRKLSCLSLAKLLIHPCFPPPLKAHCSCPRDLSDTPTFRFIPLRLTI